MNIKSLTIQNFKAYGSDPATFEFSDINLIFGKNSVGKSTALNALKYFSSVLLGKKSFNVDEFSSLLNYNQDKCNNPVFRVELSPLNIEYFIKRPFEFPINLFNRSIFIEIEVVQVYGRIVVSRCALGYDGETLLESESFFDENYPGKIHFDINYDHPIYSYEINIDNIYREIEEYEKCEETRKAKQKLTVVLGSEDNTCNNLRQIVLKESEYFSTLISSISEYKKFMLKYENGINISNVNNAIIYDDSERREELRRFEDLVNNNTNIADLFTASDQKNSYMRDVSENVIPVESNIISILKRPKLTDVKKTLENKQSAVDFLFKGAIDVLLTNVTKVPESIENTTLHIGPLRKRVSKINSFNKETGDWYDGSAAYHDIVNSNEYDLNSINSKLRLVSEKNDYKLTVNNYLYAQGDVGKNNNAIPDIKTLVLKTEFSDIVDFSNVGTGISQSLPIIIALEKKNKILILEQPELHLHPSVTMHLADIIVDSVKNNNQIFIETHSEHIILRILRHIREQRIIDGDRILNAENVSINYVDHIRGKLSTVRILIDDDGDFITEWPNGFFVERAKELF